MSVWRNWARTVSVPVHATHRPTGESEIQQLLSDAAGRGERIKVVGAGHSCGPIAAPDSGSVLRLDRYTGVVDLNIREREITVKAGTTVEQITRALAGHGLALENMGDVAHQTIAGALSTGTHGTGVRRGALDQQVTRLRLVDGQGGVHELSADRHSEMFEAARVGLGALGVISEVTLRCVPAFTLEARSQTTTFEAALAALPDLLTAEFGKICWFPHTDLAQLWRAEVTDLPATPNGPARRAWSDLRGNAVHELALAAARLVPSATAAVNRAAGRWMLADPPLRRAASHEVLTFPIRIRQYVSEWAVPLESGADALRAVRKLVEASPWRVHSPIEVRFAPSDDAWMSMAYGRPTCYIGIIMYRPVRSEPDYRSYFREVGTLMGDFDGRPHWAKTHYRTVNSLRGLYPRWEEFCAMRSMLDPRGVLLNDYLRRVLDTEPAG